jgi:flagellar motor switch protein FliN/FliY
MSPQTSLKEFLAQEFCEAFASVFEQTTGESYVLRASGSAKQPGSSENLNYVLEFSGRLKGKAFVQIALQSAAVLATTLLEGKVDDSVSYLPEHEDALFEIISQTAGVLATLLRNRFGTAEVSVQRANNGISSSTLSTIILESATGTEPVSVALLPEQALLDSIAANLSAQPPPSGMSEFTPPPAPNPAVERNNLQLIMDVELSLTLRFGQRVLMLSEVADLATGSVVELDRVVDDPVELMLGERVIARGEVVIVDGNYGLRITDLAAVDHNAILSV